MKQYHEGGVAMDRELAQIFVQRVVRGQAEISSMVPLLKEHCDEVIYKKIGMSIARILDQINVELLDEVFAIHPDIEAEFENRNKKYGRSYY